MKLDIYPKVIVLSLCLYGFTAAQVTTVGPAVSCAAGPPGSPGSPGRDGRDGRDGMTIPGPRGDRGDPGFPGNCDCPGVNLKQCTWKDLNDGLNTGQIKNCSFTKKRESTALRLTWHSDLRVYPIEGKDFGCTRWYFTINGEECTTPNNIDAILLTSTTDKNEHRPSTIDGICEKVAAGPLIVTFNVGLCPYGELGDAHTGWQSVSRIIIEELNILT